MTIVIIDIDGTLADNDHRAHHVEREEGDKRPKDWDAFRDASLVIKDKPIEHTRHCIEQMLRLNYHVMFVTGRDEAMRDVTARWLKDQYDLDVNDDTLHMRGSGNMLSPAAYKRDTVQAIKSNYPRDSFILIDDDRWIWPVYAEFGLALRAPECWATMFPVTTEVEPLDIWRR
jgi:predicted secreted acid phosphatase